MERKARPTLFHSAATSTSRSSRPGASQNRCFGIAAARSATACLLTSAGWWIASRP